MRVRNTFFFFQAEDGIRDKLVTGVQTCALPILSPQVERTVSRGRYEQDEFRLIEQVLSPGDVVLEVGAGLGLVSAYCAKRLGSSPAPTSSTTSPGESTCSTRSSQPCTCAPLARRPERRDMIFGTDSSTVRP